MSVGYYRELVREFFDGKRVILAMGPVAGSAGRVKALRELGVAECLIVGDGIGTGEVPDPSQTPWVVASMAKAPDMLTGLRNYEAALRNPSPEVVEAVERFDPDHRAIVLSSHVCDIEELCGRPRLGPRLRSWLELEDKVVVDAFWDRANVARAPSEVVDPHDDAQCGEAAARLGNNAGVVWAGDAREGINGGAMYVRYSQTKAERDAALEFFRSHCDRVRVMPYLEGIPCSIHGVVFPEKTIAFRPVEMVVFRRPNSGMFLYTGFATFWDPPASAREAMRAVAKRVGRQLAREVGYRGAFTVDGVLTAKGFVPTEFNTRTGGAFGWLVQGEPDLPLQFLEMMIRDGVFFDYRPAELEELVLKVADTHRVGGGWTPVKRVFEQTRRYALRRQYGAGGVGFEIIKSLDSEGADARDEDLEFDAMLLTGPSAMGGFVRVLPEVYRRAPGLSVAPEVAAAFALVDREFGTNIGVLEAAKESYDTHC
ncbi:hypothetical protein FRC96_08585 [Lujinxingia vulgaris]|uniref:ATP-grasp domain-containing protein n=1 Tax=Lujinxingia vulgaris TaxID=2600176 RepID=A0A5C6XDA8_9DELT|nr:hypothetical protein [Lujinxingia vulgaris]TXD36772.1 hypothetical protein FRC96_08585 [Lujinxingia vulgaris]